jgi:hypothetical protein
MKQTIAGFKGVLNPIVEIYQLVIFFSVYGKGTTKWQ